MRNVLKKESPIEKFQQQQQQQQKRKNIIQIESLLASCNQIKFYFNF